MRFEDFAIDKKVADEEGVWHVLDNFDDLEVRLARWGNRRFNNLFSKLTRNKTRQIQSGRLDSDEQDRIVAEVTAKTVLLDWSGMRKGDEEIAYDWRVGKEVLLAIPELYSDIRDLASDEGFYRSKQLEEEAGNSDASSDGN